MGILDGILTGYTNAVLGPAPTDVGGAYAKLQTELNSKYEKAKQAYEADPNNKGKQYQMPDALQRWNDQISGMITSGDPVLQKAGIAQMTDYHKRATESDTVSSPNSVKEYQYAQAQGFQGSYQDWVTMKAAAGRNSVNVNVNSGEKWVPLDQLANFTMPDGSPIPPGTTMNQLHQMGALPKQNEQQRLAGTAGDVLANATNEFGESLFAASGDKASGVLAELRTTPGAVGTLADVGLNLVGRPMKEDEVKFSNFKSSVVQQTVKLMSGASATDSEKEDYRRMLPKFTDPPAVRKVKFEQAQQFADTVIARNKAGGVRDVPVKTKPSVDKNLDNAVKPKSVPQQKTSSNGYKYTIEN